MPVYYMPVSNTSTRREEGRAGLGCAQDMRCALDEMYLPDLIHSWLMRT